MVSGIRLVVTPVDCSPANLHCPWGLSRQESWSGLPLPPPGDLPEPRDGTRVSCIGRRILYPGATGEAFTNREKIHHVDLLISRHLIHYLVTAEANLTPDLEVP